MAASTSRINIEFLSKGDSEVNKAFKRLGGETRRLNRDFQALSKKSIAEVKREFQRLGAGQRNSINAMQAQRNALNGLRNMADVTSIEFKQLTADIAKLDAQMRKAGTGATGFKGKLKGFAKGVGAVASGGIFGGVEGALGAGIGLSVGGAPGAIVGAAIGAQLGQVRQGLSEIAAFSAELSLQRKALRLVIGDFDEYNKAMQFLNKTSKEFAIPQEIITRQFTSLTASVLGAGMTVDDAKLAFEAIAAGIRGTGGSLEDMKSAMRAVSQVFSKGKVSAEELRQQLGERLPGAFTLFAESMDKTPAELDKALEQGKVTLDDFMKFANKLFDTYGENAKILADSPAAAGDRLQTALSVLKDNIGQLLRPIGAEFQDTFTIKIIKPINDATEAVMKFYKLGDKFREERLFELLTERENLKKRIEGIQKLIPETGIFDYPISKGTLKNQLEAAEALLNDLLPKIEIAKQELLGGLTPVTPKGADDGKTEKELNNIQKGAKAYFDTIKDFGKQTQDAVTNAFKGMEDALVKFVLTGKLNFSDLARSIISDLTRITVRAALLNVLSPFSFFDKVTGGNNAKGNVYDAGNKITKFAYGGTVVRKPTVFPMANGGVGLMGEAGPEGILPLKRGRDGKLGVIAQGGSIGNIVVNVDASGSSVEGNEQDGKELGRLISVAIQSELINQRRPGGLLA